METHELEADEGGRRMPVNLATIRTAVQAHEPRLRGSRLTRRRAATSIILHEPDGNPPEMLFMLRTSRPGDRWSGQMALPGGRYEPGDPDLETTASREAFEEVGVELGAPIGRLDDQGSRVEPVIVSTFVYEVDERPAVTPDPREVAETVWIPVPVLLDPDAAYRYRYRGVGVFPAIRYRSYTVWGLTLRTLEHFFGVLGLKLPPP